MSLLRASSRVSSSLGKLLKTEGLSEPQFNVLRILRGAGTQGLPCQKITVLMITRVPDVTRLIDRLQKRGLVTRNRGASGDRRVVLVTITEEGLEMLERLDQPVLELHRIQFSSLEPEEVEMLVRLLNKTGRP